MNSKHCHRVFLACGSVILLGASTLVPAEGAGINEKQLAVDLTFEPLPPNLTNFDLQGFKVSGDALVAYGTLAGTMEGSSVTVAFQVPVADLQATCEVVSLVLGPVGVETSDLNLNIAEVNFDVVALPATSPAVQSLTCTIAHIVDGGGNAYALAAALNRLLPAIQ